MSSCAESRGNRQAVGPRVPPRLGKVFAALAIMASFTLGADYRGGEGKTPLGRTSEAPSIAITSPANGSTVSAGETVSVTLSVVQPGAFTRGISVIGEGRLGAAPVKSSPPFTFTLTVPSNLPPGNYQLTALGFGAAPRPLAAASIILHVEPISGLLSLTAPPEGLSFEAIGEQLPLRVIGGAAGGRAVNLAASSAVGLVSADSSVATVDSQGLVTAVGQGQTAINLTLSGHGAGSVPIRVVAPALIPSATSLGFGNQAVGTRSQAQSFTIRNALSYPLRILAVSSPDEFPETSDCPALSPISAGGSCTVRVWFAPRRPGIRSGAVSITDSAVIAPTRVYLSGTGMQKRARFPDRDAGER